MKRGFTVLFTGLAASGKTTICQELQHILKSAYLTEVSVFEMDKYLKEKYGESALTKPTSHQVDLCLVEYLGGRVQAGENILIDRGNSKESIRRLYKENLRNVVEVHVDCPLHICIARDFFRCIKGNIPRVSFIYARALVSHLLPFYHVPLQGITTVYEPPLNPDVKIASSRVPPQESARIIIDVLIGRGYVRGHMRSIDSSCVGT